MSLPSHVPIQIDQAEIDIFREFLERCGYAWTFFQIVKPGQEFGLVKEVEFGDDLVDHHIRCSTSGKITTEIELRRIKDLWLHLTSHSISAHELVLPMLKELSISFQIDDKLREIYAENGPITFRRDHMEFFRWLVYGVLFWTPIGYIWKFFTSIRNFLFK